MECGRGGFCFAQIFFHEIEQHHERAGRVAAGSATAEGFDAPDGVAGRGKFVDIRERRDGHGLRFWNRLCGRLCGCRAGEKNVVADEPRVFGFFMPSK